MHIICSPGANILFFLSDIFQNIYSKESDSGKINRQADESSKIII